MQTILGASGQIGTELAKVLHQEFTKDIRLVSRNPEAVNDTDQLVAADLLDAAQTDKAVVGSDIVYFTAGLPLDTKRWQREFPLMMQNVIDACIKQKAKLVFFDNTYMYPQTATPHTERTPFQPNGKKGRVRAQLATMLQNAMDKGLIEAMICRAPEFYGPGKTQSITNATVLKPLKRGQQARVFLRDDALRTLIYTPDASRAMAWLANADDAYQQTWHLPCDDERLTYKAMIQQVEEILGRKCTYKVLQYWQLWLAGLTKQGIRETRELLPRYKADNIFMSDKFKERFPDFRVTPYREGLESVLNETR